MQDLHDIKTLIQQGNRLITIESLEEPRILQLLTRLGIEIGYPMQIWSHSDGLRRLGFGSDVSLADSQSPDIALAHIKGQTESAGYVFCDLHPFLDKALIVRLIKDVVWQAENTQKVIILVGPEMNLPKELKRLATQFHLTMPSEQQLHKLVLDTARDYARVNGSKVKTNKEVVDKLVRNLKGLTFSDATHLIKGAIVDDGILNESDLTYVNKAKMDLLGDDGVIHFEYDTSRFSDVAGLNTLKGWLNKRRKTFLENSDHYKSKGIMLFGVQGSGKSLAAKAVAGSWGLPLLRLDMATLFNKYIGETERQLREALTLADAMSPCVLWVDEIEKGISSGDQNDGGVSQRCLGTLLTWLSEKNSSVFMVMTANNIKTLPPELMRKGRLDEIFFVDLPNFETRVEVMRIHLSKRNIDPNSIELEAVAQQCDGFSGAEIEQAIIAAYHHYDEQPGVTTGSLLASIQSTTPLSVTMAESIEDLRNWAQERSVSAD